jgi:hypothetical protein
MQRTLAVINRMQADGIIGPYTIAGAVAAYNWIEASVTKDLDILISFENVPSLLPLDPIFTYLKERGCTEFLDEGIVIEGRAVQFIPVTDDLDAEALAQSLAIEIESTPTHVLRPEHIVATALRVGGAKYHNRIIRFLEAEAVDVQALCAVIRKHGLGAKWKAFLRRIDLPDPCRTKARSGRVKPKRRAKLDPKWAKQRALMAEVLERKAKGRRHLAGLSISEKIKQMDQLRGSLRPFREARERRKG